LAIFKRRVDFLSAGCLFGISGDLPWHPAGFAVCRIRGIFPWKTVSVLMRQSSEVLSCVCVAARSCSRGTSGGRTCASFVAEPADSTEATSTDFSFSSV